MTTAKDILNSKKSDIVSIADELTVYDAVTTLAKFKIGFLIVTDSAGNFAGVLSERDVVQKCINFRKLPEQVKIKDIMTGKERVISGSEDDHVESIMNTMTEKKIRHLPVFKGDQLKGIISIGDVIKILLHEKDNEIKTLASYVSGNYPG
ncbi:MAG: CBS domain-containing protein [Bacteroidota bacterium]|jgi:CBS domain-containing protein